MQGLRQINEESMIAAHKAGVAYWRMNRPAHASRGALTTLAKSNGWHGEDCTAWLAGFYGAKARQD